MDEQKMGCLLAQDYSAGTAVFREELLERCLEELTGSSSELELSDGDLDMLAAAGTSELPESDGTNQPFTSLDR